MDIGIPRERKLQEHRVALVPEAVAELVRSGHSVLVETRAGQGSGFTDQAYSEAGAQVVSSAETLYAASRLIVKVKEPIPEEFDLFRSDHLLFSFLHLAAAPALARFLCERGVTALAFETLQDARGHLPLLAPMSAIAGRVAAQYALTLLHAPSGGRGILLGGSWGTERGLAIVLGAGTVGKSASFLLSSVGARVDAFDLDLDRTEELAAYGPGQIAGLYPYRDLLAERIAEADVVVGAVLSPGAHAPKVVSQAMVASMRPGSVVADVAVDQGGCVETTRPTDYAQPTYEAEGVVHFAVTNMPAAVPRSATKSLSARLLPYVQDLAKTSAADLSSALAQSSPLESALNVLGGEIRHPAVARALKS